MAQQLIKGYQWMANMAYGGIYEFPRNLDKVQVHLPPNTTLVAPPAIIPEGQEAYWNGTQWALRLLTVGE
jgi:hypothetical protein